MVVMGGGPSGGHVTANEAPGGGGREGRRYGGLTPPERRAARRQRLLDSGLELFATQGYSATTIEGICAAAGVTARHFYEEFRTREELLRAVLDVAIDTTMLEIGRSLAESSVQPDGLDERVRRGVSAFVQSFLEDPRRARIACIETVGVSAAMEAHRRDVIHQFAGLLEAEAVRLADQGVVRPGDFTLTTLALVGGTNELIVDWLLETPRPPLAILAEVVTRLFLAVIEYS